MSQSSASWCHGCHGYCVTSGQMSFQLRQTQSFIITLIWRLIVIMITIHRRHYWMMIPGGTGGGAITITMTTVLSHPQTRALTVTNILWRCHHGISLSLSLLHGSSWLFCRSAHDILNPNPWISFKGMNLIKKLLLLSGCPKIAS